MKNLGILILALFCITTKVSADGIIKKRNRCFAWLYKHNTISKVWTPSGTTKNEDKDCFNAQAYASNECAWVFTYSNNNTSGIRGGIWGTPKTCGRGPLGIKNLKFDYYNQDNVNNQDSTYLEESKIEYITHFDSINRKITIDSLNGFLKTTDNSALSSFELTIWLPNDDIVNEIPDTIITPNKIIWSGKIIIENGQVTVNGNFSLSDLLITSTNDSTHVALNNINLTINLPPNISINDVEIYSNSHGFIDKDSISINQILEKSNLELSRKNANIELYPNPTNNKLIINNLGLESKIIEFSVYNLNGQLLIDKIGFENYNGNNYEIDLTNEFLPFGVYYLLIKDEKNNKYVKKFIYTN